MSRALGPMATWRVMQILGDLGAAQRTESSAATRVFSRMGRGQFIKGLGGAVVGMGVLSGVSAFAASAGAREEHWLTQLSITSSKELSEKRAAAVWSAFARHQHLRSFLSSRAIDENPAATSHARDSVLSALKTGVADSPVPNIKGVRHQLKGGGKLLTLMYQDEATVIVSYRLDEPGQKPRLLSRVIEDDGKDTIRVLAEAEDDDVFVAPQGEPTTEGRLAAAATCRSDSNCPGACNVCRCASYNRVCVINCCGPCAGACSKGWSCLGCVSIWCPLCVSLNRCCYYKTCRWREACA